MLVEAATIDLSDFERVDMRVGRVLEAEPFPEARKPAYKLRIDFGPLGVRRSSAQLTVHYRPEELRGRLVIAVLNFPPRQIGPVRSDSQKEVDTEQFASLAKRYRDSIGFKPDGVHVRSCEEQGRNAVAHVVLIGRSGAKRLAFKDGAVLRRGKEGWRVILPPSFGSRFDG
jgi:tRNA-binding protein